MTELIDFISSNLEMIYIVILMIFVGVEVIGHVPAVLHTPLMSGANAISGVIIIGGIIAIRQMSGEDYLALSLATLAIVLGMINVVGGFAVTNRMLEMFKKKKSQ